MHYLFLNQVKFAFQFKYMFMFAIINVKGWFFGGRLEYCSFFLSQCFPVCHPAEDKCVLPDL